MYNTCLIQAQLSHSSLTTFNLVQQCFKILCASLDTSAAGPAVPWHVSFHVYSLSLALHVCNFLKRGKSLILEIFFSFKSVSYCVQTNHSPF